jgi:hypothetical protein
MHVEPIDGQLPLRVRDGHSITRHLHDDPHVLSRERGRSDDGRPRSLRRHGLARRDGRRRLPVRLELSSDLQLCTLERLDDVDFEGNVADDFEVRVKERDEVRSLRLQVCERRWERDSLPDDLAAKGREEVELEGEVVERVDLEGEDLALVAEGEDDAVGDGDRVGLGSHHELEGRVLAASTLLAESDGGREGRAGGVGVAEGDVNQRLLVEVVVTIWGICQ